MNVKTLLTLVSRVFAMGSFSNPKSELGTSSGANFGEQN
jgi:hypothetical protein